MGSVFKGFTKNLPLSQLCSTELRIAGVPSRAALRQLPRLAPLPTPHCPHAQYNTKERRGGEKVLPGIGTKIGMPGSSVFLFAFENIKKIRHSTVNSSDFAPKYLKIIVFPKIPGSNI